MNQLYAEVHRTVKEHFAKAVEHAEKYGLSKEEMLRMVCHEEMADFSEVLNGDSRIREYCILKLSRRLR